MDFLELLNRIGRFAKPAHAEFVPLDSMDQKFMESSLDSLDTMIVCMYLSEIYGIDEESAKEMRPTTPAELLEFIEQYKTRSPESVESAMESIK